ncbi:MAG: N-acetyltransferase GCN5 [Candidatus Kaiserbacteria bacterium GW2011_GWA2_58_9]|uniref:N-acetyltransferase GCN5 n=1 Tax=Candidatus Kaiserbacteria bacterium GW2011_GWA2_58_9 TaxID=1618672 RepID=A0A0G1YRA3_9BACT|nr:MAG: N-acetyltransferase GCN5 [Candidatus Kaiserbacteria bacterium GW2011_GWA2_58_9]
MAVITRLRTADRATCGQIGALVRMLSSRLKGCSPTLLRKILASPETELWVGKEGKTIAAMGTLALVLRPEGIAARIEDVVVDPRYQRQGLGEAISEKLIERAKARGAAWINLSSRSDRVAANKLYQKLGFILHDTNVYELKL